jgi:uncharacterized membrane protein
MRTHSLFIYVIIGIATLSSISVAHAQTQGEHIKHFDVELSINADATVHVQEKIEYDFGDEERHGIFRKIPVKYKTSLGNQAIDLKHITIVDESGNKYTFEKSRSGKYMEIKIGDADKYVSGVKTYIVSYDAARALGYFDTFDEFYWNATGNEWNVPIDAASVQMTLPQSVASSDLRISCYQGNLGSTETCVHTAKTTDNKTVVSFNPSRSFGPFEGITVAVGFPKGLVYQPTMFDKVLYLIKDNWILALPILVFVYMFQLWYRKGRDPQGRRTIVPEYDSPDNLLPLEVSGLLHQGVKNSDISAEIISLAERGFLKISRIEVKKALVFQNTDYELEKLKQVDDSLPEFDKKLMDALFTNVVGDKTKVSELKNRFYKDLPDIKKAAMNSLLTKKYYPADPQKVMIKYGALAIFCFLAFWLLGITGLLDAITVITLITSGIIIIFFARIMPKVTSEGAIAREKIRGLKMYITVAEEDRIKFHNAPQKNPELFEKLLPFAMVLGVEQAWAKQFESIYLTAPSWYNDPSGAHFNTVMFTHNLSSFSETTSSAVASAPGGSSGSGGGGFSGGGGGGGGGGSW